MDYMEMENRGYNWVKTGEDCAVENSVGTLVWVRRRNGHWWPGRVLAAHEVPRSHLLVPKSGTPVKLLGKDDASVDWYNIGKSRRIKAFRCGEFDDCIERARSFGCLRSKNREKYARRDDAILHALELEKRQAEGMQSSEKSLSAAAILGPPKQVAVKNDLKGSNHGNGHVVTLESRRCTFAQASEISNSSDAPTRPRLSTTFDMDNGVPEVIPRMRDLQDFGLQVANSKTHKTKHKNVLESPSVEDVTDVLNGRKMSCNSLPGPFLAEDGKNKMESCITRLTAGVCSAPSVTKTSILTAQKRKRHPTGSSADESSYKKRDRRRPLTQVLKNSCNKVAVVGCESSGLPSSTADCHMRIYCSDGTEATSSQDAFQQAADEFRPSSEHRDFDLQPRVDHSSYGLKQDRCRSFMNADKGLTSFWSSYWDSARWPSLVSAHMDFGLLLGSSYMDSIYEGTKVTSCFPGVAYTGSATSVNTSTFHKSDSLKYLQGSPSFSDAVGIETRSSKSTDCVTKDVQEDVPLQSMSRWQSKKRRNIRKSPHCLGRQGSSFCRSDSIYRNQDPNARHMLKTSGNTYIKPLREKRLNLLVNNDNTPSNIIKSCVEGKTVSSLRVCSISRSCKSSLSCDTQRQGFHWVDVRVEFYEENMKENVKLVSLFSEVMNRAVLGYPVSVQILGSRAGSSTVWRTGKPESVSQRITTRIPRFPRHKPLHQSLERVPVRKARSKYTGRKASRKSGSTLQKTRMLSSLAPTDYTVAKDQDLRYGSHGAALSEVSKTPLVTCIPVHLVFQRIREVLYKKPDSLLEKSCEEVVANKES